MRTIFDELCNGNTLGNLIHVPAIIPHWHSDDDFASVISSSVFHRNTDGSYQLFVRVPGMKAENLNLEFRDGGIWIQGEVKPAEGEYGFANSINKFITLPEDANPEKIQANVRDGVLHLQIGPKTPVEQGIRKIQIGE